MGVADSPPPTALVRRRRRRPCTASRSSISSSTTIRSSPCTTPSRSITSPSSCRSTESLPCPALRPIRLWAPVPRLSTTSSSSGPIATSFWDPGLPGTLRLVPSSRSRPTAARIWARSSTYCRLSTSTPTPGTSPPPALATATGRDLEARAPPTSRGSPAAPPRRR